MDSWLKALGATIWVLVAVGLTAVFIAVGYELAIKHGLPQLAGAEPTVPAAPLGAPWAISSTPIPDAAATKLAPPQEVRSASLPPGGLSRQMLQNAAGQHHHALVIEYGQQMFDDGVADADDMMSVAQSYSAIEDCVNARMWVDRATDALRASDQEPSEAQKRVALNCHDKRRVTIDPAHMERFNRLLRSLRERADVDRKRLPQLEAEAESSTSGNLSVILGELYFGFGNYGKAIASIQRGLDRGAVVHLDDAYVYLGLSQQAIGNMEEARKAFESLKTVPGISARVLKLWLLYADVEL